MMEDKFRAHFEGELIIGFENSIEKMFVAVLLFLLTITGRSSCQIRPMLLAAHSCSREDPFRLVLQRLRSLPSTACPIPITLPPLEDPLLPTYPPTTQRRLSWVAPHVIVDSTSRRFPSRPPEPSVTSNLTPKVGTWVLKSALGGNCLLMSFALAIDVEYFHTSAAAWRCGRSVVPPRGSELSGHCPSLADDRFTSYLSWNNGSKVLALEFVKEVVSGFDEESICPEPLGWFVANLNYTFSWDSETFPHNAAPKDAAPVSISAEPLLFKAPMNHSYRCVSQTKLSTVSSSTVRGQFVFSSLQMEAFRDLSATRRPWKKLKFSPPRVCDVDRELTDFVPLLVGCVLAAATVLMVIVFIRGRQKSYVGLEEHFEELEEEVFERNVLKPKRKAGEDYYCWGF